MKKFNKSLKNFFPALTVKKQKGFTLAEILLSLTVIGIVAAIALPSLLGNANERAWETQKKALYTRFSQALPLLPSLNGYGELKGNLSTCQSTNSCFNNDELVDTAAESFIRDGLSKVMKVTNICNSDHLGDCGLPDKIIPLNGSGTIEVSSILSIADYNEGFSGKRVANNPLLGYDEYEQINTKVAAFETTNGESILVYYNPECKSNLAETAIHFTQPYLCANFVYDLNGKKGPNTVGKDIGFITALYSTNSDVVAPNPYSSNYSENLDYDHALEKCKEMGDGGKLPNIDEATALFYNKKIIGANSLTNDVYASTTLSGKIWHQNFSTGRRYPSINFAAALPLICIKR